MPIAGIAVWQLGFEDPSLWRVVGRGRKPDADALRALEDIRAGIWKLSFRSGGADFGRTGRRWQAHARLRPAHRLVADEQFVPPPLRGELAIWRPSDPKAVALTFDDGPDLDLPAGSSTFERKGRACDVLFGRTHVLNSPDLVAGCTRKVTMLAAIRYRIRTFSPSIWTRFEMELNATQRILQATAGFQTNLFRPPNASLYFGYLDAGPQVIQVATRLGYVIGGMDVESCDFCGVSAEWTIGSVKHAVVDRHNQIILMHDSGGDREATVMVLPRLIEELRAAGFHFVSTHELVGLPREAVMHPWHPLASVADVQAKLGAGWSPEPNGLANGGRNS